MKNKEDFLVEIGTEEMPAAFVKDFAIFFKDKLKVNMKKYNLNDYEEIKTYATPRRIALIIKKLSKKQQNQIIEKQGPSFNIAFDNKGNPTKAALGFAKSCNTTLDKLEKVETDKGSWLFFKKETIGEKIENLIPKIVTDTLKSLPIKTMRWGESSTEFIRPVRWIVAMYGKKTIKTKILNLKSGNLTHGHRFLSPDSINLEKANDYESVLKEKGFTIASFEKRKKSIEDQIKKISKQVVIDEDLLDEITGLVEWPVALLCNFSKDFLKLPKEFLISAMQKHQKCFPIRAEKNKNKLVAKFITISNIESKNQKQVIDGNEKVMNARLFDANFFFQNDLKTPLLENVEKLKNIIFQEKLGTLYDKTKRMTNLSITIAKWIKTDPDITEQAACVSKCDLTTKIVGEFPELQGIAGFYYSENKVIGNAIKEQYLPRFAKDTLPKTKIGAVLAIADRIDSIVGIFGINEIPTGSKDPFALRRAALGILRIIIEKNIDIDLIDLIDQSMGNYPFFKDSTKEKVLNFMFERLRNLYLDNSKISNQIFSSVFVKQITNIVDFNERIKGVLHFQKLKEASSLSSANKRVNNILKDIKENEKPDEKLFTKSYEKRLYSEILRKKEITKSFIKNRKYKEAFLELAKLNTPINNFFDNVMVMTNDGKIKNNRIKLLNQLKILFSNIADISL